MIAVYGFLWARYIDYAKKYQLQIDSVTDFNTKLAEIQVEAVTILGTHYQASELVRSLLSPWIRWIYDTTDQFGQFNLPERVGVEEETTETFYRIAAMAVTDGSDNILFGISPAMEAEIVEMQRIPQRKPNLAKSRAYYNMWQGVIQLWPKQAIPYALAYIIYPTAAVLAFTYTEVNGEFIQTYDPLNTVDLAWDMNASNLLLYMLLEKYGISSRDDLLQEYGKVGIDISLQLQSKQ